MRLRHRLLALFAVLGVLPLLAMGLYDYAHSIRALDALIAAQTDQIAGRAAAELRDRLDLQESDLALLGGNAETLALLGALSAGDSAGAARARRRVEEYLGQLWASLRYGYERVALLDQAGRQVYAMGEGGGGDVAVEFGPRPRPSRRPIVDPATASRLGTLEFTPRMAELTRSPSLGIRFGERGWTAVVDRGGPGVLRALPDRSTAESILRLLAGRVEAERGWVSLDAEGSRWVVSWVNLAAGWMVLAAASVDEFAAPFVRLRLTDLGLLIGVVAIVALAFAWLLKRSMGSLEAVTLAADRVGAGDLSPDLPPAGRDEVGRLSAAFGTMTARIREMIGQVEASRQTAVLGRFAAELSHEIRNPLTAIKISLQGLERDAREGRIPEASLASVRMALREIRRLDDAVRVALRAGRPAAEPMPVALHGVVTEAVDLLAPQAAAQGVTIRRALDAGRDECLGDAEALRGALVNILLNAVEAMPKGGIVSVTTAARPGETIEIRVADEGPGIPPELRERIFKPFFTTKDGGTGLGLSLALQTARAHGGTLSLADVPRGAEVVITVPLAPAPVPA